MRRRSGPHSLRSYGMLGTLEIQRILPKSGRGPAKALVRGWPTPIPMNARTELPPLPRKPVYGPDARTEVRLGGPAEVDLLPFGLAHQPPSLFASGRAIDGLSRQGRELRARVHRDRCRPAPHQGLGGAATRSWAGSSAGSRACRALRGTEARARWASSSSISLERPEWRVVTSTITTIAQGRALDLAQARSRLVAHSPIVEPLRPVQGISECSSRA